jgi:hypothetical protein
MFYYIEVHLLAHYIQWIKMHGKTAKNVFTLSRIAENSTQEIGNDKT